MEADKWENTMNHDEFMALRHMMDLQVELQRQLGTDINAMNDNELMAFIREQMLACTDELHEALQETGWKTWANNPHLNIEAFRAELIDAWQFLMNLMWVGGMTPEMLVWGHAAKVKKNLDRNAAKYDGVSTKCPVCRRALDDVAVLCTSDSCDAITPDVPATMRTSDGFRIGSSPRMRDTVA